MSSKQSRYTYEKLKDLTNDAFTNHSFLDCLISANVTPVFKKDEPTDRENYGQASVLPLLSKVFKTVNLWPTKKIYGWI